MKAHELYARLDKDFGIEFLKDDWSFMKFNAYITPGFQKKYMGLVSDNSTEVKKVYIATIPDLDVLDKLLLRNETDLLLFSHHAMCYDPTIEGFPFYDIPEDYLYRLKKQRISFYVLHVPLDKNGEYSTAVNLARNLKLEIVDAFCEFEGIKAGVICKSGLTTATSLAAHVESIIGHPVKLLLHGRDEITDGRIAVAAGGGSVGFVAKELAALGINMYITGNTRRVPSVEFITEFHQIIEEKKINVIGATHYSTEKFACMAMVGYFEKLGLPAEFLEGKYFLEDL